MQKRRQVRLGLCCLFQDQPIHFRTTTAKQLRRLSGSQRPKKLQTLAMANANALRQAIGYCAGHAIGGFRVNSQILPLATHPELGYAPADLGGDVVRAFRACGELAGRTNIRLSFHPDQFVVLNSPRPEVVESSLAELEYQAVVAEWLSADVINLHAGGGYGDKKAALRRLATAVDRLSDRARHRLTLENDDRIFGPGDLVPVCTSLGLPFVYDVHHHRCLEHRPAVERVTERALATWNREPLFHISSPRAGWRGENPRPHSDFVDLRDFPVCWDELPITVDVEAKAKELAVAKLADGLKRRRQRRDRRPGAQMVG